MKHRRFFLSALLSVTALTAVQAQVNPALMKSLKWEDVGPDRGGRSIACSGVKARPTEFYFGAVGGGLWKSTDSGKTWNNVSDGFFGGSVGAVAVSESNPDVVYCGLGERDIRGNAVEGEGLYKSTDAGKTWTYVGLKESRVISRIVIDPKDPNTAYVAALGKIFGSNNERGIFKTTDGGKSWKKVLFVSDKAGGNDLILDPFDSKTLWATTWECSRKPWEMSSGGPGSKIFRSTDGGETWTEFTRSTGLPQGLIGKVCLALSPVQKGRIWAMVEAADGGLYRSDDNGANWKLVNREAKIKQRPWYFSKIVADTKEKDWVYALNVGAFVSKDGGSNFSNLRTPHADNHDLWISSDNNQIMIEANDGGAAVTLDKGKNWSAQTTPTAQFYHVAFDGDRPYPRLLGAQQDNSSIRLSLAPVGGRFKWTPSAGGESGYLAAKPDDPDVVLGGNYGGTLEVQNHRNNMSRSINPWPNEPVGHGAIDARYRFQWTYPILFSPHDKNTLYVCSQYVMKSTDLGQSYQRISPDLSRNDPKTMQPSGGPITKDNTGVEVYGTVFTVAESSKVRDLFWAGTDDGLVWVKKPRDKWQQIRPADLPYWARCSMIEPSPFDAGTAYLAANNYQNDDTGVYLYRTRDFGATWTKITAGIPDGSYARVIRCDPINPKVVYAGTETGAWVSFDEGDHWQTLGEGLPNSPVHDLAVQGNLVAVATHGRSFWLFRNASELRAIADTGMRSPMLANPGDSYRFRGAVATNFYATLKDEKAKVSVIDAAGKSVYSDTTSLTPGWNSLSATMSVPLARPLSALILWNQPDGSIALPPGKYTFRVETGGKAYNQVFNFIRDPREIPATDEDIVEQVRFAKEVSQTLGSVFNSLRIVKETRSQWEELVKEGKLTPDLLAAGNDLLAKMTVPEEVLHQTKAKSGQDVLNYPVRVDDKLSGLMNFVTSAERRPPKQAYEVFADLKPIAEKATQEIALLYASKLPQLNELLKKASLKPITIEPAKQSADSSFKLSQAPKSKDRDRDEEEENETEKGR